MKKIILILFLTSICQSYSQKKKAVDPASTQIATLAKADNITAQLIENKAGYKFYLLVNSTGKPDTLFLKKSPVKNGTYPTDCKIKQFTVKGTKLYLVNWNEKTVVGNAKTRLENITYTHSEIWDISKKIRLLENIQTTNNITEIVWLDPNSTASKTVEKVRREGFEFTLTPDGDIMLKNKTQQDKLTYDAAEKKYIAMKSAPIGLKKK